MIQIKQDTFEGNDFQECLQWLEQDGRYIHWLTAETDTPELLEDCMKHLLYRYGNDPKDSFVGLENMLKTMDEIRTTPGINLLKDAFVGKPAILALTGPSLTKQLPHLKQQKGLIIAPDVSVPILESNGIQPHFMCALERGECTTECTKGKHKAYFIVAPVVPNSTYAEYDGPKLIAYRKIDHFKYLPFDRGTLDNPGIVGNMCYALAKYLGCSPIIIIGGDHAFEGRKTHADGMADAELMENIHADATKRVKVEGYYGGEVETAEPYLSAMRQISFDAKETETWNCTEGGAYIDNCIHKPFSEVQTDGVNWFWQIEKRLKKFNPDTWDELLRRRDIAVRSLQDIIKVCNDGIEGKATIYDVMTCQPMVMQILVMHVVQSFHLAWMMKPGDTQYWFFAMRDSCRRILDAVEKYPIL